MNDVKLIIDTAKRTGMTQDELKWELAKYRTTAEFMYGISREQYVSYVNGLMSNIR